MHVHKEISCPWKSCLQVSFISGLHFSCISICFISLTDKWWFFITTIRKRSTNWHIQGSDEDTAVSSLNFVLTMYVPKLYRLWHTMYKVHVLVRTTHSRESNCHEILASPCAGTSRLCSICLFLSNFHPNCTISVYSISLQVVFLFCCIQLQQRYLCTPRL